MDTDTNTAGDAVPVKHVPRKPRPSEIAAKKAKAAAKKAAKKRAKMKRKPASSKSRVRKAAKKVLKARAAARKPAKKAAKRKASTSKAQRTERLDMRVTKDMKRQLGTAAKRLDRTVTAVAWLAIQKGLKGLKR